MCLCVFVPVFVVSPLTLNSVHFRSKLSHLCLHLVHMLPATATSKLCQSPLIMIVMLHSRETVDSKQPASKPKPNIPAPFHLSYGLLTGQMPANFSHMKLALQRPVPTIDLGQHSTTDQHVEKRPIFPNLTIPLFTVRVSTFLIGK